MTRLRALRPLSRADVQHHLRHFARYVLVGCATVVVDLTVFQLLLVARAPLPIVVTGGYSCATAFQFFANKRFTFRDTNSAVASQALSYAVIAVIMWLAALGMVEFGVLTLRLAPLAAKICTIPITSVVGYTLTRHFVFKARA